MIEQEITMSPIGNMLVAENNRQDFKWLKYIAELIDNAFDAKASNVVITRLGSRSFSVKDDGIGCDELQRIVRYGERLAYSTEGIGRYGVGGKDVAIALWGLLEITSIWGGEPRCLVVDWDDVCRRDFPPTKVKLYSKDELDISFKTGTEIIYSQIGISKHGYPVAKRNIGNLFNLEMREKLEWRFRPILLNGGSIQFKTDTTSYFLKPFNEPKFEESFAFENQSINNKSFSIHGGIVKEGQINDHPGFHLCHSHRIIESTGEPCGDSGVARIFAWVQLSKEWQIERNKEKMEDIDRDDLMLAISSLCGTYIEKASRQSKTVRIKDLENLLSERFTQAFIKAKEKRSPKTPQIPPIHIVAKEKFKRTNIRNYQHGFNPLRIVKPDQLRVEFGDLSETRVYSVDVGNKTGRVLLNSRNDMISKFTKDGDDNALFQIAVAAFATYVVFNRQLKFKFPELANEDKKETEQIESIIFRFSQTFQSKKLAKTA